MAYVAARAAAMAGDHASSAELMAALAERRQDSDLSRKALVEAMNAGNLELAIKLAREVRPESLPNEARLMMAAEQIRARRPDRGLPWLAVKGENGDLNFLAPLLTSWMAADRGDLTTALRIIEEIPVNSLLGPLRAEQQALLLLKFKRSVDAEPFARRAIGQAGARETRLRLAFADGFLAAGDRARALIMIEGMESDAAAARQRVLAGKMSGQAIGSLPEAFAEVITAFAADVARLQRAAPPIGLVQVARYADPQNSSTTMLLALLLDGQERSDEALALLSAIPANDALISHARDIQARILSDAKRYNEAYAIVAPVAALPGATAADFSRLGDLYQAMNRHAEAADAYGRAVALARASTDNRDLWSLLLLRADALEQANRRPEARQALEQALPLAPEQPLLLNFLGYGKLERGEDIDAAEAMIRKASDLAPENASITDSLGWAEYKRGRLPQAIATLQRAAQAEPSQAEIQEHLGDALYTAGRRYEARFAWRAALVNAEASDKPRIQSKIDAGLTASTAAR